MKTYLETCEQHEGESIAYANSSGCPACNQIEQLDEYHEDEINDLTDSITDLENRIDELEGELEEKND